MVTPGGTAKALLPQRNGLGRRLYERHPLWRASIPELNVLDEGVREGLAIEVVRRFQLDA